MTDQAFSMISEALTDHENAYRRRIQNRIAQRKFRARKKAQQQGEVVVTNENKKTMVERTSGPQSLDDMFYMNIPESTHGEHQSPYPGSSSRQHVQRSQETQAIDNQFLSFGNFNFDKSVVESKSVEEGREETCNAKQDVIGLEMKQATAVIRSQRTRICDQAAEQLEKTISLYDFGVSLGILEADSKLRDLLVNASDSFHSRRFVDLSDETEQSYWVGDQ